MDLIEIISQELNQIPQKIYFTLSYVPCLPVTETENSINPFSEIAVFPDRYWIPWTERLGAWINLAGDRITIVVREDAKDIPPGVLALGFTSVLTGICLNLQGQVAIHANAVSIAGYGAAFVGYSGMGKSTLSAFCASAGAGFITDDVLVVDSNCFLIPGSPRIKLYPHTGSNLGLDASQETTYKIFYSPNQLGAKLHSSPLPLGIIYLLEKNPSGDNRIYSETVSHTQAVFELLNHGYDVSHFIPQNPKLLDAYTRLAALIPIKRLYYPRDFSLLPKVYDFLSKEMNQLCLQEKN